MVEENGRKNSNRRLNEYDDFANIIIKYTFECLVNCRMDGSMDGSGNGNEVSGYVWIRTASSRAASP